MIICNNDKDYEILFSLRSHGWFGGTRFYSRKSTTYNKLAKKYLNLDPRYIFSNTGFNLRPTDIQAAIAHNQFKRLENLKKIRDKNKNLIINKLINSVHWKDQFKFIEPVKNLDPSWMGLPILLNKKYLNKKKKFLNHLTKNGIENRPILSGNFTNQPATKLYNLNKKKLSYVNAQKIENIGFFIGLHTKKISNKIVDYIADNPGTVSSVFKSFIGVYFSDTGETT